jgi:hypothetical protein
VIVLCHSIRKVVRWANVRATTRDTELSESERTCLKQRYLNKAEAIRAKPTLGANRTQEVAGSSPEVLTVTAAPRRPRASDPVTHEELEASLRFGHKENLVPKSD